MDEQTINDIEKVLPPGTIDATVNYAERMAQKTGEFLRDIGVIKADGSDSSPVSLPSEFLLELAALLQWVSWENCGIGQPLVKEFPQTANDLRQLLDRFLQRPLSFCNGDTGVENAQLSQKTTRIWLERFAWDAPELMQSDVLLSEIDDDEIVDRLADFLWKHRHKFQSHSTGDTP